MVKEGTFHKPFSEDTEKIFQSKKVFLFWLWYTDTTVKLVDSDEIEEIEFTFYQLMTKSKTDQVEEIKFTFYWLMTKSKTDGNQIHLLLVDDQVKN